MSTYGDILEESQKGPHMKKTRKKKDKYANVFPLGIQNTPWTPFEVIDDDSPASMSAKENNELLCANSRYSVNGRVVPVDGLSIHGQEVKKAVHLSIKRLDKEPMGDWREMLRIKNELVGEEAEAVELFPSMTRLVDAANQFHLWCLLPEWGPTFSFIGFHSRHVEDAKTFTDDDRQQFVEKTKALGHEDTLATRIVEGLTDFNYVGDNNGSGAKQRRVPEWMKPGVSDFRDFLSNYGKDDNSLFEFQTEIARQRFIESLQEKYDGLEYATSEAEGKFLAAFKTENATKKME